MPSATWVCRRAFVINPGFLPAFAPATNRVINQSDTLADHPGTDSWERAQRAQQSGDYRLAAGLFLDCVADSVGGSALAHFKAAWCFEMAKQSDDALAHYALAVEQTSDSKLAIEARYRLGWLALEGHEPDRAGREFSALIQLADSHRLANATVQHARYWHALCLEREGRLVDAATRYEPIIEDGNPDLWHEAAYRRLLCLTQIGDLGGALAAADVLLNSERPTCDPPRLLALKALAREEKVQINRAYEGA